MPTLRMAAADGRTSRSCVGCRADAIHVHAHERSRTVIQLVPADCCIPQRCLIELPFDHGITVVITVRGETSLVSPLLGQEKYLDPFPFY